MLIMKIKLYLIIFTIFLVLIHPARAQAQLSSESNIVTTKVGTPTSSGSTIAAAAIDLAATIAPPCSGAVKGSNINCLNGLTFTNVPYATGAIGQIIQSTNANYCNDDPSLGTCLQCVGFVQAAVMGATGTTLNKGGNAKDYASNVPDGYQYIPLSSGTPIQEGDIIIKTGGSFGHIAVVVEVLSQTAIKIAEANYNFGGEIGIQNTTPSVYDGFLRKQ